MTQSNPDWVEKERKMEKKAGSAGTTRGFRCPRCGISTWGHWKNCPECGETLNINCAECGAQWRYIYNYKHCPSCGAKVGTKIGD